MRRFAIETERLLRRAGWFEGRAVPDRVQWWQTELESKGGFGLSPIARQVLNEFGGLHIQSEGPGSTWARSDLNIDPTLAAGEGDRFFGFRCFRGKDMFPLGEASRGHLFAAIDSDGKVYLVMDQAYYVAESFDAAVEVILWGGALEIMEESAV